MNLFKKAEPTKQDDPRILSLEGRLASQMQMRKEEILLIAEVCNRLKNSPALPMKLKMVLGVELYNRFMALPEVYMGEEE